MEKLFIGSGAEFKFTAIFETDQGPQPWNVNATGGRKMLAVIKTSNANTLVAFNIGIDPAPSIEVIDAAAGEYLIRLQPSVSAKAPAGDSKLEIKIAEPNDDFDDSTFMTIGEADLVTFVPALTSKKVL